MVRKKILVKDYIEQYGKINVQVDGRIFYCDGIDQIGGVLKKSDFKTKGMI